MDGEELLAVFQAQSLDIQKALWRLEIRSLLGLRSCPGNGPLLMPYDAVGASPGVYNDFVTILIGFEDSMGLPRRSKEVLGVLGGFSWSPRNC